MASTSQISNSLHSRRRNNNRPVKPLTLFFVGGLALVVTPAVMVVCQDAALRQEMSERAHVLAATVSLQMQKLNAGFSRAAQKSNLSTPSTLTKTAAAGAIAPAKVIAAGEADKNQSSSTSDVAENVSMVDQAVSLLTAQIAKEPNNPSLHNRLGLIYASVGELQQAEAQFNLAIDRSREQLSALKGELAAEKAKGEIALASKVMLDANAMELELSSAHSNLARVFEKLGQQSKVVAQLDQLNKDVAIGDGPTNDAVKPITQPVAVVKAAAGAPAAGPEAKRVSPQLVATLAKAQALLQAGRINEAVPQLRAVLAIDPHLAEAHEQLGAIGLASGNYGLAIEELSRAREDAPKKASTRAALGVAYQYKGKVKEAIAEFKAALALNPKDASSAFNLGNACAATAKNDEAISYYRKAISINPNMAVAHNNLASLYSLKGNYEAAEKEFESALTLSPNMYSAHYGLGLALYHNQDYASASREFKAALALNPSLVDAHHKIAMCDRQSGQTPKHMYQDVAMR